WPQRPVSSQAKVHSTGVEGSLALGAGYPARTRSFDFRPPPGASLRMTTFVGGGNRTPVATNCHRVPCPTCAGSRPPSSLKCKAHRPFVILSGTPEGRGVEGSLALGQSDPAGKRSFDFARSACCAQDDKG